MSSAALRVNQIEEVTARRRYISQPFPSRGPSLALRMTLFGMPSPTRGFEFELQQTPKACDELSLAKDERTPTDVWKYVPRGEHKKDFAPQSEVPSAGRSQC